MELKTYLFTIKKFLKDHLANKFNGYLLGLSGGLDSSVLAKLTQDAVGNDKLLVLVMPCESNPQDIIDAKVIIDKFNLRYKIIDLTPIYQTILKEYEKNSKDFEITENSKINLKVRLRMVTLYFYAASLNSLVLGTDNLSEYYTGYFTKYGDGAADLLPLVWLTKREVKEVAKLLEIPDEIINKTPTAGLVEGQTDEKEMGITYDELDDYLIGKIISPKAVQIIETLHKNSNHKREPIPRPIKFNR